MNTINKRKNTMHASILFSRLSNLRCMKYNNTKDALIQAINIATPTLNDPKSNQVTVMVIAVKNSRITRIIPYTR